MKIALASFFLATLTLSSSALASEYRQKVDLSIFKERPAQGSSSQKKTDIQKILDSKVLEQKFLNGIQKLRLGTNSGGGGDDVGLDFQRTLQMALEGLRNQEPKTFKILEEKNIIGLARGIKIIVVDEELEAPIKGYTQNSVAVNLPHIKTILVNRQRWNNVKDSVIKEGIALHEIVSLLKLESTGRYDISSRYVVAKGGKKEALVSVSQVNRLQQIQSLDETLRPREVLNRLFEEASDPISILDFDLNTDQRSNQKCQGIRDRRTFLEEFYVRRAMIPYDAASDRGPLFPAKPASLRLVYGLYRDDLVNPRELAEWGERTMSTTGTELQMKKPKDNEGYSFYTLARRNGNLLALKMFIASLNQDGNLEVYPEKEPTYIYCYRQ